MYKHSNIDNARELRKNMTKEERHLWYDFLREYPIKFYRQRAIDNYIVDFYCHKALVVIELDGSQHYSEEGSNKDNNRTKVLNKLGIEVVRFSNLDVLLNFDGVCTVIDMTIKERVEKLPASPSRGGGCN